MSTGHPQPHVSGSTGQYIPAYFLLFYGVKKNKKLSDTLKHFGVTLLFNENLVVLLQCKQQTYKLYSGALDFRNAAIQPILVPT